MDIIVIVIMLALVQCIVQSMRAGLARGRAGIKAPAVTGNENFERHFRVHYNTLEQLVIFVPGVWFFAQYVHVTAAAVIGVVYLAGRMLYAISYVRNPETRGAGMMLSAIPCWILVLGALGGAVWSRVGPMTGM